MKRPGSVFALMVVLLLVGCGSDEPAGTTGEGSAASTGTAASSEPQGISFEDAVEHADGVEVAVADITTARLGELQNTTDETATTGDPYTILTVRVRNGSEEDLDLLLTATLYYGPDRKPAGEVTLEAEVGGMETLPPGDAASHDWGWVVPEAFLDEVRLEVGIDLEHDKSVFSGSLRRE